MFTKELVIEYVQWVLLELNGCPNRRMTDVLQNWPNFPGMGGCKLYARSISSHHLFSGLAGWKLTAISQPVFADRLALAREAPPPFGPVTFWQTCK